MASHDQEAVGNRDHRTRLLLIEIDQTIEQQVVELITQLGPGRSTAIWLACDSSRLLSSIEVQHPNWSFGKPGQ